MNPRSLAEVERVLNQVRPYIQADGGDVQLVDVLADGVVRIRLTGACRGCASAHVTVLDGIQAALQGELAWVRHVEQVHDSEPVAEPPAEVTRWVESQYDALCAAARHAAVESSAEATRALLGLCDREFERLFAVEDQCLHAAFDSFLGLTNSPISMLRHEQAEVRDKLANLRAAGLSATELEQRARIFFNALEHHCQKERSAVWPFVNNALPDAMARELQDEIQRFVANWKPATPVAANT